MTSTAPIGVFDSGLGGISVAREIRKGMPNEQVLSFGASATPHMARKHRNRCVICRSPSSSVSCNKARRRS